MEEGGGRQCALGSGEKLFQTYLDRRRVTVAEWVDLLPILRVCTRETGYEGRGKLREPWWRQEAEEKQLVVTLTNILGTSLERR